MQHPFITGEDQKPEPPIVAISSNEKESIAKEAEKVKDEELIENPKDKKDLIIHDGSIDESEYNTNGNNQKAHFYIISKVKELLNDDVPNQSSNIN